MKIVIYMGVSQYQALRVFAQQLAFAFETMGAQVRLLDFGREDGKEQLLSLIGQSYDMILSMNGLHADLRVSTGDYLHDLIDAPFYAYFVDHPLYHHERLKAGLKNYHAVCVDPSFAAYVEKYYPHVKSAAVVMQGGVFNADGFGEHSFENRSQDVVFMGTYRDLEDVTRQIAGADETVQGVVCGMADVLLDTPSYTLEEALEQVLKEAGIALSRKDFSDTMNAAHFADLYIRTYYRKLVVQCLAEQGIAVHVYGKNWDHLRAACRRPENLILHGPVAYLDAMAVYRDAKIVLNLMPWAKHGIHDRLLNAMLAGALVVSDESTYLERHFQTASVAAWSRMAREGRLGRMPELLTFSLKEAAGISGGIAALLENPEMMRQMAAKAQEKAARQDTWAQRAEALLRCIG